MRMNTTIRLLCSAVYLSMGILPSQAADVKVLYRANSGVVTYDSSTAPGQTTSPGVGAGTGTGGTAAPLAVPAPTTGLAVASGGTWNVVVTPTGGKGPYTFVATGTPAGVGQVDDGSSLVLNGVAAAGSYAIKVAATDKDGTRVESSSFTVVVAAPAGPGSHQYWRVSVSAVRDYRLDQTGIREIQMAGSSGVDLTTGGTSFSSSAEASYPTAQAFDKNENSSWYSATNAPPTKASPQSIGYRFATPVAISQVKLATAGLLRSSPRDFDLQWSDDGVSYTTSAFYKAVNATPGDYQTFSTTQPVVSKTADQHHYWRVGVTRTHSGGRVWMNEFKFLEGTTDLGASTSGLYMGNLLGYDDEANVYDGSLSTNASSNFAATPSTPVFYGYGFSTPKAVSSIGIVAYGDNDDATDIMLQWSDDGSTWTTSATHTNIAKWGSTSNRFFKYFSTTVSSVAAQ